MFQRSKVKPTTSSLVIADASTLYTQYPQGIRYYWFGKLIEDHNLDPNLFKAYYAEWLRIADIIVDRNQRGQAHEKAGDIDAAITEYEANVTDQADTPHPYDRLRIIYARRKDYANAIRICEQHCATMRAIAKIDRKQHATAAQLCEDYVITIAKYHQKLEKHPNS